MYIVQVTYCMISPEASNSQEGHKPQTQISPDHE